VSWKHVRKGDAPPPCPGERLLDHTQPLVGMDERCTLRQDATVLGDGAAAHSEEEQRPRLEARRIRQQHHLRRRLVEHLDAADLSPIAGIGRHLERLRAYHLAPDAAYQAEAVAARAATACLIMIGRAQPAACRGDNTRWIGRFHSGCPLFEPSRLA
jgi:hypothetical protein